MMRIIYFFIIFYLSCTAYAVAASPAMVERHIFTPEPDLKSSARGSDKSPLAVALEKQLSFTGVIISPQGKWVMIREKRQKEGTGRLKEGDEIKGMVIKEISSNYIAFSGQGKEVRLNLYQGNKMRPSPSPEPKTPAASKEKNRPDSATTPSKQKSGANKTATPKSTRKTAKPKAGLTPKTSSKKNVEQGNAAPGSNPFAAALRRAAEERKKSGSSAQPATNPFLEAIRRAQGK